MTEKTFQKHLDWLWDETRAAMDAYNAREELYRLAERSYIVPAMLADASFWRVHRAGLQHTLFVILG